MGLDELKEGCPILWCDHDFTEIAERPGISSIESNFDNCDSMLLYTILIKLIDALSLLSSINANVLAKFNRRN